MEEFGVRKIGSSYLNEFDGIGHYRFENSGRVCTKMP